MSTHAGTSAPNQSQSSLPLDGVRVLDLTTALSGPFSTQTLADMGADVIKVERPTGDDSRKWGPPFAGTEATYFLSVNRNKRSIALDLKDAEDLQVLKDLVASSDVLVENYRPGVTKRLGISFEDLRENNPRLVYCSISGYGATMPPKPGYDQVVQATSGWMSLTGDDETGPMRTGVPIGDIAAGMNASQSILAALFRREQTGQGAYVDISMQDTLISMLAYHGARYFATGENPKPTGNMHPLLFPYGVFKTQDGSIVLAVGNDVQFGNLCRVLDREDLASAGDFATNSERKGNQDRLLELLNTELQRFTTEEILDRLSEAGVPAGPIRSLDEVLNAPETQQRNVVLNFQLPDGQDFKVAGGGWRIDDLTAEVRTPPPGLNQHSEAIRAGLTTNEPTD